MKISLLYSQIHLAQEQQEILEGLLRLLRPPTTIQHLFDCHGLDVREPGVDLRGNSHHLPVKSHQLKKSAAGLENFLGLGDVSDLLERQLRNFRSL